MPEDMEQGEKATFASKESRRTQTIGKIQLSFSAIFSFLFLPPPYFFI